MFRIWLVDAGRKWEGMQPSQHNANARAMWRVTRGEFTMRAGLRCAAQ
eukprot:COSAG01_NODE_27489_length_684_cov_1.388034_2_plen_47_part_01